MRFGGLLAANCGKPTRPAFGFQHCMLCWGCSNFGGIAMRNTLSSTFSPQVASFDRLRTGPREGAELNGLSCHELPLLDPG